VQQLRELGGVGGNPPRLVVGHEMRRRTPSRLLFEITHERLFLIAQQFSFGVPDLQAVPVDNVMIWT
jgi:hypothetical protein